jgi:hypothetical protein
MIAAEPKGRLRRGRRPGVPAGEDCLSLLFGEDTQDVLGLLSSLVSFADGVSFANGLVSLLRQCLQVGLRLRLGTSVLESLILVLGRSVVSTRSTNLQAVP